MKKQVQKGFTLIELIVVIAVLALLAGVAVPKFINATARAKASAEIADVGTVRAGIANTAVNAALGTSAKTTGTLTYPATLTIDTTGKKAFSEVLEANSAADMFERGWKVNGAGFEGPNGGIYTYTASTGSFIRTGGVDPNP
jgi:type IV pilus assembly protein PilA